ncbi:MAG: hypothetical protein SO484_00400 [Bacilli bacterium]|nr:hypothetical protein [Bacilli bacterium]
MAKYDDAYFENLTKEANVIYRCLYLNEINDNLKNAIINYLDVYFDAYKKYSNLEQKDDDLTKIFNILGGPINEVDNPYNLSLNDGKPHPAIDLIKERLEKFYNELNNNAISQSKGFSRELLPASAIKGIKLYNDENGFAKSFIIIIVTILLGILIAGLTIYFKLK